jgi:hypothetical protein
MTFCFRCKMKMFCVCRQIMHCIAQQSVEDRCHFTSENSQRVTAAGRSPRPRLTTSKKVAKCDTVHEIDDGDDAAGNAYRCFDEGGGRAPAAKT